MRRALVGGVLVSDLLVSDLLVDGVLVSDLLVNGVFAGGARCRKSGQMAPNRHSIGSSECCPVDVA